MRVKRPISAVVALGAALTAPGGHAQEPVVVSAVVDTAPLFNYEEAPATPDADDPAIWINPAIRKSRWWSGRQRTPGCWSTICLAGSCRPSCRRMRHRCCPRSAHTVWRQSGAGSPCADSESGETFGRFNNVDIAYNVPLGPHGSGGASMWPSSRIAAATACDSTKSIRRIRTGRSSTSPRTDVPRVFADALRSAVAAAAVRRRRGLARQSGRRSEHGIRADRRAREAPRGVRVGARTRAGPAAADRCHVRGRLTYRLRADVPVRHHVRAARMSKAAATTGRRAGRLPSRSRSRKALSSIAPTRRYMWPSRRSASTSCRSSLPCPARRGRRGPS